MSSTLPLAHAAASSAYVQRRLHGLGISAPLSGSPQELALLIDELDRLAGLGYGASTQRRFLHCPHPRLGGSAPIETLASDGTSRVLEALQYTLRQAIAAATERH
jgi:hypothetical protein